MPEVTNKSQFWLLVIIQGNTHCQITYCSIILIDNKLQWNVEMGMNPICKCKYTVDSFSLHSNTHSFPQKLQYETLLRRRDHQGLSNTKIQCSLLLRKSLNYRLPETRGVHQSYRIYLFLHSSPKYLLQAASEGKGWEQAELPSVPLWLFSLCRLAEGSGFEWCLLALKNII